MTYRSIDLFAGIGGIRLGFERAFGESIETVFASEWDRFAVMTYRANFDDGFDVAGDITKIGADDIPDCDILLAGFPCQPFSIAGVSKKNSLGRAHGFDDKTQGTLFFDVARILDAKRPRAFLLENVKNLKSHDKGRTWRVIESVLKDDLGYSIHPKVIDAAGWTCQHRERIYIVGFRDDVPFDWGGISGSRVSSCVGDILEDGDMSGYALSDHLWEYLQGYAAKHRKKGNGFGYGIVDAETTRTRTLSARYYKDGSEILVSRGDGKTPRMLSPRECARLQGFPDSFAIPVSKTQAYKQFGNSVCVPAVAAVASLMRESLGDGLRQP